MEFTREILEALGAPFPEDEVEFLPRGNWEGKARALAYIDARSVMRRLDAVVGPDGWSFDFDVLSPDGKMVRGKLTVLGITKCDAGEGSSEDEVLKSAVSDALKRAAVHFGIGRYLYYLPSQWAAYDQRKRQFTEPPRIAPAAVEKALSICGIPTTRPVSRAAASTTPHAEKAGSFAGAAVGAVSPELTPAAPTTGVFAPNGGAASDLACSRTGCGKPLTRGQHDVSVRAYGTALCPACQRSQARRAS